MSQRRDEGEKKMTMVAAEVWVCLGKNEDQDTCDCCGKSDLKETYRMGIKDIESDEVVEVGSFGCVCAGRHAGRTASKIRVEAKNADQLAAEARRSRLMKIAREMVSGLAVPAITETMKDGRMKFECGDAFQYVFMGQGDEERFQYGRKEVVANWMVKRIREAYATLDAQK
jgi:hypothetical protein